MSLLIVFQMTMFAGTAACEDVVPLPNQAGTWVYEYLACIQSAESAGMSRAEARQSCGQALTVQEGDAELLEELEAPVSAASPHSVQ